jgi:DsbC/DsbD-like thiol-disulfide interchange protein
MKCPSPQILLLAVVLALVSGRATASEAQGPADVELLSAVTAVGEEPVLAGILIRLAPGWKTYWRNPGDSGIAPTLDSSGSENLAAMELLWPAPTRFDLAGETIFGYEKEIVLPLLLRAADPEKRIHLKLALDYAVCSTLCVPLSTKLELDIPAGRTSDSENAMLLRRALSRVPVAPREPEAIDLSFEPGLKPHLRIRCGECASSDGPPELIVDGPSGIWFGRPEVRKAGKAILYAVPVEIEPGFSLAGEKVRLIFAASSGAIEVERQLP